jgi:hypothetical protein
MSNLVPQRSQSVLQKSNCSKSKKQWLQKLKLTVALAAKNPAFQVKNRSSPQMGCVQCLTLD